MDLSPVTALVTGYVAFRLGLRQDDRRWSRERRVEVYLDLLRKTQAEFDYIHGERPWPPDLPVDLHDLNPRIDAFASASVIDLYESFIGAIMEGQRWPATRRHAALVAQIREELAAERSGPLWWHRISGRSRQCKGCAETFTPKGTNRTFCSPACQLRSQSSC